MSASWDRKEAWREKVPDGYHYDLNAFMGTTVLDHREGVAEHARRNQPERLVVQLGSNSALGGWGGEAHRQYQDLVDLAPDRTCVVAVLPFLVPDAVKQRRPEVHLSFETARTDITRIIEARPMHVIADMAEFADANPEMMSDDGIHIRVSVGDDPKFDDIKNAYRDWLFGYIAKCKGRPR